MPHASPRTSTLPGLNEPASLLLRCAAGDRSAFRALYDSWSAKLHGIALRITRQPALAADASHDTSMQLWQNAFRFDPETDSAEALPDQPGPPPHAGHRPLQRPRGLRL